MPNSSAAIEVEVVSDDPVARLALVTALASVDEFDAAPAPYQSLTPSEPHEPPRLRVILWDGPRAAQLPSKHPIVALVEDRDGATRAVAAGAMGVLERNGNLHRLSVALRAAAAGLGVLDRSFGSVAPALEVLSEPAADRPISSITPRERQVLDLVVQGFSNRRIARRLVISEHTVKFHVDRLLDKLDARSRTDVAVRAIRGGLVSAR